MPMTRCSDRTPNGPHGPRVSRRSLHRSLAQGTIEPFPTVWRHPMKDQRFNYAGIGGAVAGVVGLLGIYADWWETDAKSYYGTADISGQLALAMSIGLFAFGVAYVVFSDLRIRRAMGALMTLCAAVLTLSCVWGLLRADNVAPGASTEAGIWVSLLGGVIGVAVSMKNVKYAADADASTAPTGDGQGSDAVSQGAPSTG